MVVPLILFLISLFSLSGALILQGPEVTLWSGLSALSAGASLLLLLLALARPEGRKSKPGKKARPTIILDGSNVMFWDGEEPRINTVAKVVRTLERHEFAPGVIFDANVGYKIGDRYQDDAELARKIKLPAARVLVVPKGVSADEYILKAARDKGCKVVTNDRFRDWEKDFPEVRHKGRLMNGTVKNGKVWLRGLG